MMPTVSQGEALGPVLQPHQLSVALIVAPTGSIDIPVGFPPCALVLPAMRLYWMLSVPASGTKIPPPPSELAPVAWLPVIVTLLIVRLVWLGEGPLVPSKTIAPPRSPLLDRKSTRLNSSHLGIS